MKESNNLNLWKMIFNNLIDNYLKKDYGLKLFTPHIIIKEIESEIRENLLQNKNNKILFEKHLKKIISNDKYVQKNLLVKFEMLKLGLESKKIRYLLHLCNEIDLEFKNITYFTFLTNSLAEAISNDKHIDVNLKETIKYITTCLIGELIIAGKDIKDIKLILNNYTSEFSIKDGKAFTKYPKKPLTYDPSIIKEYFDNLTIFERFKHLNEEIQKLSNCKYFVFKITGIQGIQYYSIEDIVFYTPNADLGTDISSLTQQLLQLNLNEKTPNKANILEQHAAVKIEYLGTQPSLSLALQKLEKAIDIISLDWETELPIVIDEHSYKILDSNGEIVGSKSSMISSSPELYNSLVATNLGDYIQTDSVEEFYSYKSRYSKINLPKDQTLQNAAHWFRKGNESSRDADRLLNYWISFEYLFNFNDNSSNELSYGGSKDKIEIIKNISISVTFMSKFHDQAWDLFNYYKNYTDPLYGNKAYIPKDVLRNAGIIDNTSKWIVLRPFISALPELRNYETVESDIKKIDYVISLFNNSKHAKTYFEEIEREIEDDITYIYRLRNLIVHNASVTSILLPYYTWKAKKIVQTTLNSLIEDLNETNDITSLMINFVLFKETFKRNLEKGKVLLLDTK